MTDWTVLETAVRAHTSPVEETEARERREPPPRSPHRLVVDVETTTDLSQRPRFAIARLEENARHLLIRHGAAEDVIHQADSHAHVCRAEYVGLAPDLPAEDLRVIQGYLSGRLRPVLAESAIPPPRSNHSGMPQNESGATISYVGLDELRRLILETCWVPEAKSRKGARRAAVLSGFNLGFDLPRLALGASRSSRHPDAFSFVWSITPSGEPNPFRPRLLMRRMGVKGTLWQWTGAADANRDRERDRFRGHFVDASVLYFALFSQSATLAAAATRLGTAHRKLETAEHGARLTAEYLHYARQDVLVTSELLTELQRRFDAHPPSRDHGAAS